MDWTRWIIVVLAVLNGGWMVVDGSRALLNGDYLTPKSGPRAGQLGPWANIVSSVGIAPRSSLMKWLFVGLGAVYLAAAVALMLGLPGAPTVLIIVAVLGLWYLPFGTLINILVILLVILSTMRAPA